MKNLHKQVAIVIPLSNRPDFTPSELISLRHLLHHLGHYDKYFIAPEGLQIQYPGIELKYFDLQYFGSADAHSRLLLSPLFYKAFDDYDYILIYHLDALVFSDQLSEWCQSGYDYIAPPWIKHKDAPYAGMELFEGKTGNGGFSLRNVKSFLKVLNSKKLYIDPDVYWEDYCQDKSTLHCIFNLYRKYLKGLGVRNRVHTEILKKWKIEDPFWANRGTYYYPDLKIAPVEIALKFAFECVPQYCYEQNDNQLPFGCHAWERYDPDFWEPFLLKETPE